VAYTFASSRFAAAPVVGGQTIRPVEGRTESEPWVISLTDVGSTVSSLLSSAGRMHLLGRLCRLRASLNSTATSSYAGVAVGRLTDVSLQAGVAGYDLTIGDERWLERQADIFTVSNTAMLIPPGLVSPFFNIPAQAPGRWRCRAKSGNLVVLIYESLDVGIPLSGEIAQLIQEDVLLGSIGNNTTATTGNFTHLRFQNTGNSTSYEVSGFDVDYIYYALTYVPRPSVATYWENPDPNFLACVLVWPSSQPNVGDLVRGYVHAPTHPPTPSLPLHVGGANGLTPPAVAQSILQGTYSPAGTPLPRLSTARFAALAADARYGKCWFRITSPENMATWLDERIYQPYAIAPVLDSSGRVAPVSLFLPTSTEITVSGLPSITSTNAYTHPTWEHPSRDIVNVVRGSRESYGHHWDIRGLRTFAADRIIATTQNDLVATADNTSLMGRRELRVKYGMMSLLYSTLGGENPIFQYPIWKAVFTPISQSFLMRYADGPIYTDVECSTTLDATTSGQVLPGRFVRLAVGTYPNAAVNARGSTRVMQVMRRVHTPRGMALTLLDAGPSLSPLGTPSLTLALSSQSSRHAVKGTVSSLSAGARWTAQIGVGASTGSTAPATLAPVAANSTATLTYVVGSLPSRRKIFARVRAEAPNRIASAWSTYRTVVTASITAPSNLTVSDISAGKATAVFTRGSTLYDTAVMLDASTAATLGAPNTVAVLPRGSTRYDAVGLTASESYKIGVRHVDPFGGYSNQDSTTFTTTTGYATWPAPRGMVVIVGGA
jgi:hypothetical protein